jgi:hypothetical protein
MGLIQGTACCMAALRVLLAEDNAINMKVGFRFVNVFMM